MGEFARYGLISFRFCTALHVALLAQSEKRVRSSQGLARKSVAGA
jgi:hypothetical protein